MKLNTFRHKTPPFLIKNIFIMMVLMGFSVGIYAQITNTTSTGNWSNSSIWDNGVPNSTGTSTINHNVTLDQDLTIEGSCRANSTIIDNAGGSQYKADIKSSGVFTINADVTFEEEVKFSNASSGSVNLCATFTTGNLLFENDATIYIDACSRLIINGDLTIKNQIGIICDGEIIVNGNVDASNDASISGSGSMSTTGNVSISDGATVFGSTTPCGSPPCVFGTPTGLWTGSLDSDWENPLNWRGPFPTTGTDVTIDLVNYSGAMAHPRITVPSSFSPNKLDVKFGGQMTISNNLTLTKDFNIDNNNSGVTTTQVLMTAGTLTINGDKKLKLKKGGNFTLTGGDIVITKDLSVEEGSTFTMNETTGTSSVLINSEGNNKGKLKIKGKNTDVALLNLQAGTITINSGDKVSLEFDGNDEGSALQMACLNITGGIFINNGITEFKKGLADNTPLIVTAGTVTLADIVRVNIKKGDPKGCLKINVQGGTLKIQDELILYGSDSIIQTGGTVIFEGANDITNDGAYYATGGTAIFQGTTTLTGLSTNWQFHDVTINGTLDQAAIANINVSGELIHNGIYNHNNQTLTFNNTLASQNITTSSALELYNVIVNSTNTVNLSSGNFNLRNTLTLTNGLFNANGLLTILSDVTGTARIAEITGGSITGNITMQRFVDAGSTNWRFLTSAISGTTIADFNDDFITSGFTGSDWPLWPTAANPWPSIYFYDETQPGIIDSGFVAVNNTSNSLGVGEGVWVWSGDTITGTQPFTIDMTGPANTGTINLPLTYSNSGSPADDGWNMVGNPYPSQMDWDDPSISKSGINNAIYIWNPDLEQFASYIFPFGTNGGSKDLASSQAFWVQTTAAGASVQVTEASKTTDGGAFLKPGNPSPLTINVTNAFGADQTIINFEPLASAGFDAMYDALKMVSVAANVPSICTVMMDSIDLSINQLPEQEIEIPLKITTGATGLHQIDFSGISNFDFAGCLILEDLFTGSVYDLNTTPSITAFIYDTTQTARYVIKFGGRVTVSSNDISCYGNNDGDISFEKNSPNTFDVIWKDDLGNVVANNTGVTASDGIASLNPGIYTIETTDLTCGNRIDTVTITEPNEIIAQFTTIADTIYLSAGGNITFTNQSIAANYYGWDFDDATGSSTTSPVHQYTQVGSFFVTLDAYQDANCYQSFSKTITVLNTITSINEVNNEETTKVWINTNHLLIDGIDIEKIEIRNIVGQILFTSGSKLDHQRLNLSQFSSQPLIIFVASKSHTYSTKLSYVRK